ncbi:SGNH hydrolase-type esterase domain-containing protein, partial [Lophiotrema nucula]
MLVYFPSILAAVLALSQSSKAWTIYPRASIKVMVVGDSISHGLEGDYTWRYRLWQWFQSSGVAVDFAGPYIGTQQPNEAAAPSPPALQNAPAPPSIVRSSGGYAADASSFDSDHFAVWGRQVAQAKGLINGMVKTYQPDYLLVELGFNDLGWFISGPDGTLASMKTLVDNARAAKPDLKFVIANVPYRTHIGGRDDLPIITDQYNALLADAIPKWSTSTSPIKLAKFRENYSCELDACPAGHDGLHPNALGEYQIAHAFTQVLHDDYGLGNGALTVPATVPTRPCPAPLNFKVTSAASGIVVTWDKVYGAFGYQARTQTNGGAWSDIALWGSTPRNDNTWVVDGESLGYMVRSFCGDPDITSDWVSGSAVAHPQTPPGPSNIVTHATADGYQVSWDPVVGATSYDLITWDQDTPGSYIGEVGIEGTSATISHLEPGHHYLVAVATWTSVGGGLPRIANSVRVGSSGAPPPPSDFRVLTVNEGATVHMKWTGSDAASGYNVWSRNINNASDTLKKGQST